MLIVEASSDKGNVRVKNEDMALIDTHMIRDLSSSYIFETNENQKYLFAVADGMGGHNAGEYASSMVIERLISGLMPRLEILFSEKNIIDICTKWAKSVHKEMALEGEKDQSKKNMGTTLTALFFLGKKVIYLHVGDSRLYRMRRYLMQITDDHTVKNTIGSPNMPSNVLSNSFGGGGGIYVDVGIVSEQVLDGDQFLLCSDGLYEELSDKEIEELLNDESSAKDIVNEVKKKTCDDNITLLLVKIKTNMNE